MIPMIVANWTPRPLMTSPSLVGKYVRVDPLDMRRDVPLLWEALGGQDGTLNEHLKWWGIKDFDTESDLEETLKLIQKPPGDTVNVFRLVRTGQVAGMANYISTRAEHGSTEVGYVAHGQAMLQTPAATEAHYLLAKHVFETMGYRRYEWKCDSNNLPSNKAALRYGFSFEGCFRQHVVTAKGRNRDTNWYSMLDKEWPERKKALEQWLEDTNFDTEGKQKRPLKDFQTWPLPS